MPCQCIKTKKEKVFETIELDYENNKEYRIVEFKCKECNRYGVEKTDKIVLQQKYENLNHKQYQRIF